MKLFRPHQLACWRARMEAFVNYQFTAAEFRRDDVDDDWREHERRQYVTAQWHLRRAEEERINDWRQLRWIQNRYFNALTECSP